MPILKEVGTTAAAGAVAISIDKPSPGIVRIRLVSLMTNQDMECERIIAYLYDASDPDIYIPIHQVWPLNTRRPALLFDGDIGWPDGLKYVAAFDTQVAATNWHYNIIYDVLKPPEPKRKKWGEL